MKFEIGDIVVWEGVGVKPETSRVVNLLEPRQLLIIGVDDLSGRCSVAPMEACRKVGHVDPPVFKRAPVKQSETRSMKEAQKDDEIN
jgi:hypothetical protein